ncbi:MAG: asparagine synthase (glutamine-hydrolyzing) [Candidatus Aenigmarchaeota archaeon]|nr:asparagine synthase (glutamine-hydrolyzing) [Candidatus Aenigmarchaeota archaeon]
MCGILGQINLNAPLSKKETTRLRKGLSMLRHRGPDSEGTFLEKDIFLGHRRLSIIDLESRSNQPMLDSDCALVFNGEIYNFLKLRKTLESKGFRFKTTSDTEVLLKAYIRWGLSFVEHLDGCWAFCIYDGRFKRVILSRDRIGEKPLYYYSNKNRIAFSSELPSLLKILDKREKNVDYFRLAQFNLNNFKHMPYDLTPFENIYKLKPGYNLVIDGGVVKLRKYLRIPKKKIEKPLKALEKTMKSSVEQTCISDVPVGILFSGGVDSSLIAAMLRDKNIHAYCFGWDEKDPEIIRARNAAKQLGLTLKEIFLKNQNFCENPIGSIKSIVKRYGEPINLFQIIYSEVILKSMKKDGIKVVIGGNGADELFYGYDGSNQMLFLSKIKDTISTLPMPALLNKLPFLDQVHRESWKLKSNIYEKQMSHKTYINPIYRKFLLSSSFEEVSKEIPSKSLIDVFNWIGLRIENEHSVTMVADFSSMQNGMELRTPFLNKEIIYLAQNIPAKYKVRSVFSKKNNKYALKKVLEKYLPKETIYAKKMGFGYNIFSNINLGNIILKNRRLFEKYLNETIPKIELYDCNLIKNMYFEHLNGKDHSKELMEILIVAIWFEEFCQ